MHKNGYTLARLLEKFPDCKVRISVTGAEMVVDVTDLDKANQANFDRIENVAKLVASCIYFFFICSFRRMISEVFASAFII